jgi:hypothetical protein
MVMIAIPKRNPPWVREEIILALDVYVRGGSLRGGPLPDDDAPRSWS